MEYNVCLKNENPHLSGNYDDKIHKYKINDIYKTSRKVARKIYNMKKHNRRCKRRKLQMETKAMIADICNYC